MNHRERVLAALSHVEPDRVPLALWGSAYGVTDPLYLSLLDHFGLGQPVAPMRPRLGHSVNYYDDRVLDRLDTDVRHVWLGFTDLGGPQRGGATDAWGVGWRQLGLYLAADHHPLPEPSLQALEAFAWPEVERLVRPDALSDRARHLRQQTDFAVVGRAVDSYGPLERANLLRGTENFMLDLALRPDFAAQLVGRIIDVLCRLTEIYLEAAGPYLDILELPGDDYAAQHPLISPRMFDSIFAPKWQRLIGLVKTAAPHCKILFHSDGRMEPFLGRLIDLGVDVFHCLEPLPNVDPALVKQKYGDRLCFLGGIDIKQALQGAEADVAAEVRLRLRQLGPGGGYILAPANHLQPDVPARNVVALFEAAHRSGAYPLEG